MRKKIGMLVYPVIYEDTPNGLRQVQLVGKGAFFTDQNKGYEYQEKMNESDNRYNHWSNYLIQYDVED